MPDVVEKKLSECRSTIEQIKDLAISLGIDPSNRWYRDKTGIVPLDVKRAAGLPDVKPIDAYGELNRMLQPLIDLKTELEALAANKSHKPKQLPHP